MRKTILCASVAALAFSVTPSAQAHHVSANAAANQAGPIVTTSPLVLKQGQIALGARAEIFDFDKFSNDFLLDVAEDGIEEVHNTSSITVASIGAAYGVTDKLQLNLSLIHI